MRLKVYRELGLWQLSDMEEVHVDLLRLAADDASMTDCEEGRQRLFPVPVPKEQELREGEFLEDWREFVSEELETQFAQDVGTLLADLDGVEKHRTLEEQPLEPRYLVRVPLEHARSWFSALNQARLMLDSKFKLHPDGENLSLDLEDHEEAGEELHERLAAYMRYEFYALIQEWLVRQVMDDLGEEA